MSELDADNNNYLDHKEARALIKRMKKVYSPRKCGKTFFFNCDKDQDSYISKNEWLACLGIHESQGTCIFLNFITITKPYWFLISDHGL